MKLFQAQMQVGRGLDVRLFSVKTHKAGFDLWASDS